MWLASRHDAKRAKDKVGRARLEAGKYGLHVRDKIVARTVLRISIQMQEERPTLTILEDTAEPICGTVQARKVCITSSWIVVVEYVHMLGRSILAVQAELLLPADRSFQLPTIQQCRATIFKAGSDECRIRVNPIERRTVSAEAILVEVTATEELCCVARWAEAHAMMDDRVCSG